MNLNGASECYAYMTMGNPFSVASHTDRYSTLSHTEVNELRCNYDIFYIDWLDRSQIITAMQTNHSILSNTAQKQRVLQNMMDYYVNRTDTRVYDMTDYICDETSRMCICNTHADDFKKIYDKSQNEFRTSKTYVSWFHPSATK